jgi:hypothetical protein
LLLPVSLSPLLFPVCLNHFPPSLHPSLQPTGSAHTGAPYEVAPEGAHNRLDKTDERSISNNLKAAEEAEKKEKAADEAKAAEKPTDAARKHGNEPSRGAKIDEQIEAEEAAELAKKDAAKNN